MIGFYDYTVILTLLSLACSIAGITQAVSGNLRFALIFLVLSGLFDTFDGKVARTKKNRTDDEKLYGIQLDSLVDVVCFGVFPAVICFCSGLETIWDIILFCFYGVAGVIRLAYYNVLETNRQFDPEAGAKVYHGLPITSITIILPLFYLLKFAVSPAVFLWVLRVVLLLTGTLFIIDFKINKLKNWQIALLAVIVGGAALLTAILS